MESEEWYANVLGSSSSIYQEGYKAGVDGQPLDEEKANESHDYFRGWQDGQAYGDNNVPDKLKDMKDVSLYENLPDQKKPRASKTSSLYESTREAVNTVPGLLVRDPRDESKWIWDLDADKDLQEKEKSKIMSPQASRKQADFPGAAPSPQDFTPSVDPSTGQPDQVMTDPASQNSIQITPNPNGGFDWGVVDNTGNILSQGQGATIEQAQQDSSQALQGGTEQPDDSQPAQPDPNANPVDPTAAPTTPTTPDASQPQQKKSPFASVSTKTTIGGIAIDEPIDPSPGYRQLAKQARTTLDSQTWFDGSSQALANRLVELMELKRSLGSVAGSDTADANITVAFNDLVEETQEQYESIERVASDYMDPEQEQYLASLPAGGVATDYGIESDGDLGYDDGSFLFQEASKVRDEANDYNWDEFVALGSQHFVLDKNQTLLSSESLTRMAAVDYARDKTMVLFDATKRAKVIDQFVTSVERIRREHLKEASSVYDTPTNAPDAQTPSKQDCPPGFKEQAGVCVPEETSTQVTKDAGLNEDEQFILAEYDAPEGRTCTQCGKKVHQDNFDGSWHHDSTRDGTADDDHAPQLSDWAKKRDHQEKWKASTDDYEAILAGNDHDYEDHDIDDNIEKEALGYTIDSSFETSEVNWF